MAMTKAERAAYDAALRDLREAKALGWSGHAAPERMPVPDSGKTVTGWNFNLHSRRIDRMWSDSVAHGFGETRNGFGNRDGIRLYATKRDAIIGLRMALEQECAKQLAAIDALIAAEDTHG